MLSPIVVGCLSELNREENPKRSLADRYLRDAAEHVDCKEDADVLFALSEVLSMGYSERDDAYLPRFAMADGRRSFAMEDLDDDGVEILKECLPFIEQPRIKAQLSDIIWVKTKDYTYARMAVAANLELFDKLYDPYEWVDCYRAIYRAFLIALRLGQKGSDFINVICHIDKVIRDMDGTDPLFLSLRLIQLVTPHAGNGDAEYYLQLTQKIFSRAKEGGAHGQGIIETAHDVIIELLKKLNRSGEIRTAKLVLAGCYEELASALAEQPHQAIQLLQKAYNLYDNRLDQERVVAIRTSMAHCQQAVMEMMASIPMEVDITTIREEVGSWFEGLSIQERVVQYGRIATIYDIEKVKQGVLEDSGKYIITSLFSKSFLDREGHLVKSVPPLDLQDPQKDEKVFRAHMLVYVTDRRNLDESIFLRLAYDKLRNQGYVSMDDLDFLVDRNAVIPDDRKEIIKRGLQLGVNGELYAAIHILLPQMENLIRELVKMCGDTVTFLREDGTEEFKPLSELLESRKLKESYDENFLFTLSTLLNERGGPNLRNENAHGFLSPIEGSSGAALCFLSLMIRFLSYYSRESIDILEKLLETE